MQPFLVIELVTLISGTQTDMMSVGTLIVMTRQLSVRLHAAQVDYLQALLHPTVDDCGV